MSELLLDGAGRRRSPVTMPGSPGRHLRDLHDACRRTALFADASSLPRLQLVETLPFRSDIVLLR